jgi:hypothetical protein
MYFSYSQTTCFTGSPDPTTYIICSYNSNSLSKLKLSYIWSPKKLSKEEAQTWSFFLNLSSGLCVDESAVLPDLAAGRVGDVAHLDHGVGELLEERGGVSPVLVHGVGRRVAEHAGPHLLVGVEEALARDEGLVVGVVEDRRRVAVHGADVVVTAVQGADFLELAEVGLGCWVGLGRHLEVAVDPVPEVLTPRESNSVGS